MRIYLAGPIRGLTYDKAVDWRDHYAEAIRRMGHTPLSPMRGKEGLRGQGKIKSAYEDIPMSSSKGIYGRDCFDTRECKVTVARLLEADEASIGTCMEIQRAHDYGRYVLVVMEKNSIHRHPFVTQAASLVVETDEQALEVLEVLGEGY